MPNVVDGSKNLVLITIWNQRQPELAKGQPASKVSKINLLRIVDWSTVSLQGVLGEVERRARQTE